MLTWLSFRSKAWQLVSSLMAFYYCGFSVDGSLCHCCILCALLAQCQLLPELIHSMVYAAEVELFSCWFSFSNYVGNSTFVLSICIQCLGTLCTVGWRGELTRSLRHSAAIAVLPLAGLKFSTPLSSAGGPVWVRFRHSRQGKLFLRYHDSFSCVHFIFFLLKTWKGQKVHPPRAYKSTWVIVAAAPRTLV